MSGSYAEWRSRLRPASFRGVLFHSETHGGDYGRRIVDHQYPDRDIPYGEDLGRAQRSWKITGYVLGPDYPVRRDALLAACEMRGIGTLVHPAIGVVEVNCRSVNWTESKEAGGRCIFSFDFAEAGGLLEPSGQPNTAVGCEMASDNLGTASSAAFVGPSATPPAAGVSGVSSRVRRPGGRRTRPMPRTGSRAAPRAAGPDEPAGGWFDVTESLSYVAESAAIDVQMLAQTLETMRMPQDGYDQATAVERIKALHDDAPALVWDPQLLASRTRETFAAFSNSGDPYHVGAALLSLADTYESGAHAAEITPMEVIPPGTEYHSYQKEMRNRQSWQRFCRETALLECGYLAPGVVVEYQQQADALMQHVNTSFESAEIAVADKGYDDVFIALMELRAAIMQEFKSRREGLVPLVEYHLLVTSNALTMAWRFYHDANRNLELVDYAHAINPAFMPRDGWVRAA